MVSGPDFRWAIAGFGWVARDHAAPAMLACGHRIAAIVDPDSGAHRAADAIGAAVHPTLGHLLEHARPDALYVATPNHLHRAPVETALRAGVPVLCEKPAAATLAEAEAMFACAEATGTRLSIAFEQRHHPAHAAIRDLVATGAIGTVTAVRIVYACWVPDGFAPVPGHDNWRIDPTRAGGGAAIDLAPHGIDLASYLLGEPVDQLAGLTQRRVHGYAVDDGALLIGRSGGGVLLSLHVAYNHAETLPRRRLEIVGTEAIVVATDTMGLEPGGSVAVIGTDGTERPLDYAGRAVSPFVGEMRAFASAVRNGDRGEASAEADRHAMRLLAGALEAGGCR